MGDEAQRIHLIAVEQQVHLHQIAGTVAGKLIVQRGVALGVGLQGIEKVINDLVQGHLVMQLHQMGVQILHILELAPAVLTHGHDVAHILVGGDDVHLDVRLLRPLDEGGVRVVVGIVHRHQFAVGLINVVDNGGEGGHQIQVKFPFQTLLNDLHVEHSQEAAAETEAQGGGGFRLEAQGCVIQLQFFQRVPQVGVLGAILGVNAAVDHGLHRPVARQGLRRGVRRVGDGVADPGITDGLDRSCKIAHLTGRQGIAGLQPQRQQMTALHDLIGRSGGHHFDGLTGAHGALHDAEIHHHAPIAVILAVKDQRLQRGLGITLGSRDIADNILQHRLDVDAHLGGDFRGVHGGQADDVLYLLLGLQRVRSRQVDLVEHGEDLQIVLHSQISVGQGLGLHALCGVHHQNSALTGGQRPGNLVVEVHMARRVDEVQFIGLAVLSLVVQLHGTGLDGDAPLPLQIHVV